MLGFFNFKIIILYCIDFVDGLKIGSVSFIQRNNKQIVLAVLRNNCNIIQYIELLKLVSYCFPFALLIE